MITDILRIVGENWFGFLLLLLVLTGCVDDVIKRISSHREKMQTLKNEGIQLQLDLLAEQRRQQAPKDAGPWHVPLDEDRPGYGAGYLDQQQL